MYTKLNLLPAKVASKNTSKAELNHVAFYGNRTIATDSFRLLEVQAPLTDDGFQQATHEPVFFHPTELRKLKLKKNETITTDGIEKATGVPANPHFTYPDVDHVIDRAAKEEDYVEVKMNGRLLGELLIAMSKSNVFEAVTLRVPTSPYKAIYATADGEQPMRGLCMPMNR